MYSCAWPPSNRNSFAHVTRVMCVCLWGASTTSCTQASQQRKLDMIIRVFEWWTSRRDYCCCWIHRHLCTKLSHGIHITGNTMADHCLQLCVKLNIDSCCLNKSDRISAVEVANWHMVHNQEHDTGSSQQTHLQTPPCWKAAPWCIWHHLEVPAGVLRLSRPWSPSFVHWGPRRVSGTHPEWRPLQRRWPAMGC